MLFLRIGVWTLFFTSELGNGSWLIHQFSYTRGSVGEGGRGGSKVCSSNLLSPKGRSQAVWPEVRSCCRPCSSLHAGAGLWSSESCTSFSISHLLILMGVQHLPMQNLTVFTKHITAQPSSGEQTFPVLQREISPRGKVQAEGAGRVTCHDNRQERPKGPCEPGW